MSWMQLERQAVRPSLVVRVLSHFTDQPVPYALRVRLAEAQRGPVLGPSGRERQADGTYRFVDIPDGAYTLEVHDPAGRWTMFEGPISVTLPLADPLGVVEVIARPGASWPSQGRQTLVRGRLQDASTGAPIAGLQVSIDSSDSLSFSRHTWSDDSGDFTFPVISSVTPSADGRLPLRCQLDGGARAVQETRHLPDGAITAGADFSIWPGRDSRLLVAVSP